MLKDTCQEKYQTENTICEQGGERMRVPFLVLVLLFALVVVLVLVLVVVLVLVLVVVVVLVLVVVIGSFLNPPIEEVARRKPTRGYLIDSRRMVSMRAADLTFLGCARIVGFWLVNLRIDV
jgi:E3 ubiquitin-protein ligase UBR1/serine/arginine repetitive matrix protein 2